MRFAACILSSALLLIAMGSPHCMAQKTVGEYQRNALKQLKQMRERGEITQEDYQQMLKAIRGQAMPRGAGAGMPGAEGVVRNPSWGFTVTAPAGWMPQVEGHGAVLVNPAVQGTVLVTHHDCVTVEDLGKEMRDPGNGESRPGVPEFKSVGEIKRFGKRGFVARYVAVAGGTSCPAKCVGMVAPGGGGPYVFALSQGQKYSAQLDNALKAVIQSVHFADKQQP